MSTPYIGRFAPSPTGPLHFGSLVAAVASHLDARANNGHWLVRMDDIDPPREMPGAAATILRQLREHGLDWDGEVLFQSTRFAAYQAAVQRLLDQGMAYHCDCSRQRLRSLGGVYDGRCRNRNLPAANNAVRVRAQDNTRVVFNDLMQGVQRQDLNREQGDFVIWRRDNLPAYQLAAAVDDAFQEITHVIRGSDLLDSTGRQIYLLGLLGHTAPVYGHIPVAINPDGQKLSKQNLAPSLDNTHPATNLSQALEWLGMTPAPGADIPTLLANATLHWRRETLTALLEIPAPLGTA